MSMTVACTMTTVTDNLDLAKNVDVGVLSQTVSPLFFRQCIMITIGLYSFIVDFVILIHFGHLRDLIVHYLAPDAGLIHGTASAV